MKFEGLEAKVELKAKICTIITEEHNNGHTTVGQLCYWMNDGHRYAMLVHGIGVWVC